MFINKNKEKHLKQLTDIIITYFGTKRPYFIEGKMKLIGYRKTKKICKLLGIYQKYYDDTPSESEEIIDYICGI